MSMETEVNVVALVKDGERYVFLYDDQSAPQLLQTFGQYASDQELNFSWYDAATLSQKVRAMQHDEHSTAKEADDTLAGPHQPKKKNRINKLA